MRLGGDGPSIATFTNPSGKHIILVVWKRNKMSVDSQRLSVNASPPVGASITISTPELLRIISYDGFDYGSHIEQLGRVHPRYVRYPPHDRHGRERHFHRSVIWRILCRYGLYDPPTALQPAHAVVVPTLVGPSPTMSATPADPPAEGTPRPTALLEQDDLTPSQAPDNPPEPTSTYGKAPKTMQNDCRPTFR